MEISKELKDFLLEWCFYNDELYVAQMKDLAAMGERVEGQPFRNFSMLLFSEELPKNN
jgi:hypothetical protein